MGVAVGFFPHHVEVTSSVVGVDPNPVATKGVSIQDTVLPRVADQTSDCVPVGIVPGIEGVGDVHRPVWCYGCRRIGRCDRGFDIVQHLGFKHSGSLPLESLKLSDQQKQ